MSVKNDYPIGLNDRQIDYLDRMAEKHGLPDRGKAIRCLIDFAMHEPTEEDRLFGEQRCSGC